MDGLTGCRTDENIDRHTDDQTNHMMVGQMEVEGMYKWRNEQTNWTDELMNGRTDIDISMSNLAELGPVFHPLGHMFPVRLIMSGVLFD